MLLDSHVVEGDPSLNESRVDVVLILDVDTESAIADRTI